MYLGKYIQGNEVFFEFRAWLADPSTSLVPVAQANPIFTTLLVNDTPTIVEFPDGKPMAACEYATVPGLFRGSVLLQDLYSAVGSYAIRIRSVVPVAGIPILTSYLFFEIGSGGDINGTITSMAEVARPDTRYLIVGTTSGEILRRKNPRVPQ